MSVDVPVVRRASQAYQVSSLHGSQTNTIGEGGRSSAVPEEQVAISLPEVPSMPLKPSDGDIPPPKAPQEMPKIRSSSPPVKHSDSPSNNASNSAGHIAKNNLKQSQSPPQK